MRNRTPLIALLLACAALSSCSRLPGAPAAPEAVQSTAVAQAVAAAEPSPSAKACEMITAAQMSTILGSEVSAQPNEGSSGKTECIYAAVKGISPYVEFTVEWGEGETAMRAAGTMAQHEPGIASPYDGIGDQAMAMGTGLMIRSGDDLVTIMFSGVDDAPAAARKIFDAAKAKL